MNQFAGYAKYYDDMYQTKPYDREVAQIKAFWAKYSPHTVKNILSFGCGTGTYEILLAKLGYTVTGVDLSQDMLDEAAKKIRSAGVSDKITLEQGDMRDLKVRGEFDAVLMMFNIAGYLHTPADMTKMATNVAGNLKPGGIFIFDAWHDQAVVLDPPTDRTKVIEKDGEKITRVTKGKLDQARKLVKIRFEVSVEKDGEITNSVNEDHPMRYWGLEETKAALRAGGLTLLTTTSFADVSKPVTDAEWDMFVVAQK